MEMPEKFDTDRKVVAYLAKRMQPGTLQSRIWIPRPLTNALRKAIIAFAATEGLQFCFFHDEDRRPGQFQIILTRPSKKA